MGPDVMLAVAKKTVKKKGATSKSDDRYAYEGFSDWRSDLREVADDIPETDKKMEVKIKEKKVKNKIVINPVLGGSGRDMGEEIKKIGGELLEMNAVEEQVAAGGAVPLSPQEVMIAKRQAMLQTRASKQRQRTLAKVKGEKPGEEAKEEKGFNFIKNFMKEDEALAKVKADIIKKHGKGAIYDPKNPPKSKPLDAKQIQQRDNRSAAQREVDAQYGRTPWIKKGSLGT